MAGLFFRFLASVIQHLTLSSSLFDARDVPLPIFNFPLTLFRSKKQSRLAKETRSFPTKAPNRGETVMIPIVQRSPKRESSQPQTGQSRQSNGDQRRASRPKPMKLSPQQRALRARTQRQEELIMKLVSMLYGRKRAPRGKMRKIHGRLGAATTTLHCLRIGVPAYLR